MLLPHKEYYVVIIIISKKIVSIIILDSLSNDIGNWGCSEDYARIFEINVSLKFQVVVFWMKKKWGDKVSKLFAYPSEYSCINAIQYASGRLQ